MRVRMFKPQFAPLVKSGAKRQTIRPTPKRMPKVGDMESWREWTSKPYRSPQVELAQVEITNVETITIDETADSFYLNLPHRPLRGAFMNSSEWKAFAKADGFECILELIQWFKKTHDLPFSGIVIQAKDLTNQKERQL